MLKQSNPTDPRVLEARGRLNRQGSLDQALQVGLLMATLGAGARGASGLMQTANQNRRSLGRRAAGSSTNVVIPLPDREEEKAAPKGPALKFAGNGAPPAPSASAPEAPAPAADGSWSQLLDKPREFLWGELNSSPQGWAGHRPLQLAIGGGSLYGGWKLVDMFMDARRKKRIEIDAQRSKQRFEDALRGKSKIGQALDAVYDQVVAAEKQANFADYAGPLVGAGGALALGGGTLAALMTHDMAKKRLPEAVKEKAKERYREEYARRRPSSLFAQLAPTSAPMAAPADESVDG